MHENIVENLPIIFSNAFICGLSFPRLTVGYLSIYLILRILHINGYLSVRGQNKVVAIEEFLRFFTLVFVITSFASSFKIMGVWGMPNVMRRFIPKRFRKTDVTSSL
jgi:hypothetical protein